MSADQHDLDARLEGRGPAASTNGNGQPPETVSSVRAADPYVSDDGRFWWDVDSRDWRPVAGSQAPTPPTPTNPRHPELEAPNGPPPGSTAEQGDFAAERFLRLPQAPPPSQGMRAAIYKLTAGTLNLGPGAQERREQVLIAQARTPIRSDVIKVAVASAKGGAGKTTTCLGLGMALGALRNDRIIALEANTSMGTFGVRVDTEHEQGLPQLLTAIDEIHGYSDLRRYTTHIPDNRLEVLTSPLDPSRATAFGEPEMRRVLDLLSRYENLILEDLGIDLLHSATSYLLRTCDFAVVVSPDSYDGGKLANDLLDWLVARRGRDWLEKRALVLINGVRKDTLLEVDAMASHFSRRARGCLRVRFDRHLGTGGRLDWSQLGDGTRQDYLELAAALATGFPLGPAPIPGATC
jgi:putative peptide zinc metalloprotease protein